MLEIRDRLRVAPPSRSAAEVDAELRAIRAARRHGGRREPIVDRNAREEVRTAPTE